jgi:hypothetical protein
MPADAQRRHHAVLGATRSRARSCFANFDLVSAVHACLPGVAVQRHLTLRGLSSSGTWLSGERVAKGVPWR